MTAMSSNMKLITQNEVLSSAEKVKGIILNKLSKIQAYMNEEFDQDVIELLKIFYNAAPFKYDVIREKSKKILEVIKYFGDDEETLIERVIKSLELGFVHHTEHITVSEMAAELGLKPQTIHVYLYDVDNPKEVEMVKQKTKKKFIPVKKYSKLILAEKQDFEEFKEWYLHRRVKK